MDPDPAARLNRQTPTVQQPVKVLRPEVRRPSSPSQILKKTAYDSRYIQ